MSMPPGQVRTRGSTATRGGPELVGTESGAAPTESVGARAPSEELARSALACLGELAMATVSVSIIVPMGERVAWAWPEMPDGAHGCEVVVVHQERPGAPAEDERPESGVAGVKNVWQHRPGKGNAIRAGIRASSGDVIVVVPADGVGGFDDVPLFVATLLLGADFVSGQPAGEDDHGRLQRVRRRMLLEAVSAVSGARYRGLGHDVCAFWRHMSDHIRPSGDGSTDVMMGIHAAKARVRVVQVPVGSSTRTARSGSTASDGRIVRALLAEVLRPR